MIIMWYESTEFPLVQLTQKDCRYVFYLTKSRDHAFMSFAFIAEILTTARRNGNVLIVVDTAGRVLELSQLLVILLEFLFCLFFS